MNEKNPEKIFKIKASDNNVPERAAEESISDGKNEQQKLDLKPLKKELSLQDLMDFLQKNKLQPNEKIIENYYKEITENKKDREIILNTVKKLETRKEEISKEVEKDPNNKEIVKKLQELNDKISDLNTSEYLISDNIKNVVKNITNESKNINQNEESISNNNILNQNLYNFLTENDNQSSIENNKNIIENLQKNIENSINPEIKNEETETKIEDIKPLKENYESSQTNFYNKNENTENTNNENKVFQKDLKNDTTSNIFNNFLTESEPLSINSASIENEKILKPDFLQKNYTDENRISLSNPIVNSLSKEKENLETENKNPQENSFENFNPIDNLTESFESTNPIESKNDIFDNINPLDSLTENTFSQEKETISPEDDDILKTIIDESGDLENNAIAQDDLSKIIKKTDDDSIKEIDIEEPKLTKEGESIGLDNINPISEDSNILENLNPAMTDSNEPLKMKEPDFILDETRKTNNLLENLSKIMMDGFNGIMGGLSNIPNNGGMKMGEGVSNENMNSHLPNPKIIQPNWTTGYREAMRKGTGISNALGYDTKLKGDNMGLYT